MTEIDVLIPLMKTPTVLITGAASGIGRAAALRFAALGYRVFATGRSRAGLAALNHPGITVLVMDVTLKRSIDTVAAKIGLCTQGHGLDVLVNCAGLAVAGASEQVSDTDLRRQFEVNVFGLMALTRAFVPAMRRRGHGRVINIGSLAGRFSTPFTGTYAATKHAVKALNDALRMELSPFGIGVTLIEPGPVRTPFIERTLAEARKYESADSPYRAVQEKTLEIKTMSVRGAVEPEVIAALIERAATSHRAPAYLTRPLWASWLVRLLGVLPTRFTDALLRHAYRLNALTPVSIPLALEQTHG